MKRQKQEKPISDELIDNLLKNGRTAEDLNGLLKQLTKAVLERALQGELTEHLGYVPHRWPARPGHPGDHGLHDLPSERRREASASGLLSRRSAMDDPLCRERRKVARDSCAP
jgi:hypothetical protein